MSLQSALSIALTGLQTSSAQIQLSSANIANAHTAGYTKKTAVVDSIILGNQSAGVNIASYQRASDTGLTNALNSSTSLAGLTNTSYNYLTQVQSILDASSDNPALSSAISNFQTAWTAYSTAPESTAAQQTVISAGTTLASAIKTISSKVASLAIQVQNDTASTLSTLNNDLGQLQTINNEVISAQSSGQPIADLQDKQDQLVQSISTMTSVVVMHRDNGSIALYTPGGTPLIDGDAEVFGLNGGVITRSSGQNVTSSLTGGSIQAEVNFADTSNAAAISTDPGTGVIAKLQSQLTKLVDAFTNSSGSTASLFGAAYSSAVTASTASGSSQSASTVASSFFTVTNDGSGNPDVSTFNVKSTLLNGTNVLPQTGAAAISNSFTATATYTASGLAANNVTYAQLGTAILSNFQQAANTLQASSTDATTQQSYYQSTFSNTTGVNIDNELVNLTALQSAYAASAHVISTIQAMLTALENTIQ